MALLWIEGFEGFGTTTGSDRASYLRRKYPHLAGGVYHYLRGGRTGGYSYNASSTSTLSTPPLTTADTLVIGIAIKPVSTSSNVRFVELYDDTTLGVNFKWTLPSGEIAAYRGTTLLGTTSGAGLALNEWSYIELKVKCHGSAGTVDIKTGTINRLSLTDQDTKAGSHDYHTVFAVTAHSTHYTDDIYVCDTTGELNNDWLGVRKVVPLFPNGDVLTQWTPSAGEPHYTLVDEELDGTGDYVESGTLGESDLWDYQDIADVGVINGIQINTTCRETDAQSFDLITPISSGGTVYDDDGVPVGTTTTRQHSRVVEVDPDTGGLWTISGLQPARFGVKVG